MAAVGGAVVEGEVVRVDPQEKEEEEGGGPTEHLHIDDEEP
jgi:hypothetical protein